MNHVTGSTPDLLGAVTNNPQGALHPMKTSYEFLATWLRARFDDEKGASLVEYALLVALIAIICIGAITLIGQNAATTLSKAGNSLAN
jgi:pilus assembly protein Flp/PilA